MNPCKHSGRILVAALVAIGAMGCASQPSTGGHAAASPTPAAAAPATAAAPDEKAARTGQPAPPQPPTEQELAAGIQVLHIGVTASGGLVDARFKVLDGVKATALLGDPANAPRIVAGDNPPLMAPHHSIKGGRYTKDQTLFILYPNTRQAVKPSVEVYVAFGATRLGPITAQ
jgi:hypothetical protein